jgi:O-antigen ligase
MRASAFWEVAAVAVPIGVLAAAASVFGTSIHPLVPLLVVGLLALGALALWRPLFALYLALALAPLEAIYLNVGVLITPGQALLTLTAAAWVVKRTGARQPIIVRSSLTAPFAVTLALIPAGFLISETPFNVLKFLALWTVLFLLVQLVLAEGDTGTVRRVMIAVALAGAAFGVVAILTNGGQQEVAEFGRQASGRARAGFGSPNRLGEYLALAIPCQIALFLMGPRNLRWPAALSIAVSGTGLALTLSRGAYIGFAGALLLLLVWRPFRRAFAIVVPLVVIASLLGIHPPGSVISPEVVWERVTSIQYESGLNPRRVAFENVPELIRDHPLLGVGAGSLESVAGRYGLIVEGFPLNNAHNVYLHIPAERGLPSLAVFIWLLAALATLLLYACRHGSAENRAYAFAIAAAWLSLLLSGMTDNVLEQDAILAVAFVLMACAAVLAREAQSTSRPSAAGPAPEGGEDEESDSRKEVTPLVGSLGR